jgi:hypothetical protein
MSLIGPCRAENSNRARWTAGQPRNLVTPIFRVGGSRLNFRAVSERKCGPGEVRRGEANFFNLEPVIDG